MGYRENARSFSHEVTAVMLVFQNEESAGMLVYRTNPYPRKTITTCMASFLCDFFFRIYPVPKTKRLLFSFFFFNSLKINVVFSFF